MSETDFKLKVMRDLKQLSRCWFIKIWGGPMSGRGVPDIIGLVNGKFFALELKIESGRPSALQLRTLANIEACGGYARLVYPNDWGYFLDELKRM